MSINLENVRIGEGTSILYGSLTSLVEGRFQINFNSNPIQILIQSPNPTPIRCQSELQSHAESRELVLYEEATSLILFNDRSAINLPIQDNKSPAILVQRPLYTYIIDNHQNWIETNCQNIGTYHANAMSIHLANVTIGDGTRFYAGHLLVSTEDDFKSHFNSSPTPISSIQCRSRTNTSIICQSITKI